MALRSSWKGYLKLSLVSVPLKAYTAASGGTSRPISFNQLHEACHSRIQYKKVCPVHGEVPKDEIVSGYEYAKGQYVILDPDEVETLRSEDDKSITLDRFFPADTVDPAYLSGQTYYLVPDGPVGQKPYALIQKSMAERGVHAVGKVVMTGRERLVRLRAVGRLLAMDVLQYESQVKSPSAFEDELVETQTAAQELKLAGSLIDAMAAPEFDISPYKDDYVEKATQLIEAKVEGKELVTPPPAEEPQIINLMDALKESVKRVQQPAREAPAKKPARKMAASTRRRAAKKPAARKRKSG